MNDRRDQSHKVGALVTSSLILIESWSGELGPEQQYAAHRSWQTVLELNRYITGRAVLDGSEISHTQPIDAAIFDVYPVDEYLKEAGCPRHVQIEAVCDSIHFSAVDYAKTWKMSYEYTGQREVLFLFQLVDRYDVTGSAA